MFRNLFGQRSSSDPSPSYPTTSYHRIERNSFHWRTSDTASNSGQEFYSFANPKVPKASDSIRTVSSNRPSIRSPLYDHNWTTTTTADTSSHLRSTIVMSVVEGRARAAGVVGLAAIDLFNPVLMLSQFTDSSNYECLRIKCDVLNPIEVLVPNTFLNKEDNRLFEALSLHFPNSSIKTIDRKHFNETLGLEMIRNLRCDDYSTLETELKSKYYCLAASAALIKYIETYEHFIYANKSLKVVFEGSGNAMSIDPTTAKLLELIVNMNDPKSDQTLFGILNKTKTRSGYRLLRTNLLQPSTDLNLIESRLDMIEAIISSQTLFQNLEQILTQFTSIEIERIISSLVQTQREYSVKSAERKIESIIVLKHIISLIEPLILTLRDFEGTIFDEYIQLLSDERFEIIMNAINEVVMESSKYTKGAINMRLEKCHAINKGLNNLLDIARETYSEGIDDCSYMIDGYAQKYSLPLRAVYSANRGFHMQIDGKNMENSDFSLPKQFIRVVVNKNNITLTTQELIKKNNRINAAVDEIYLMSDAIISELFQTIRQYIGCLYNLSEVVSKVDLVFSLAYQCSISSYVRPDFSQHLAIKQGYHPVLEKIMNRKPIPNNIYMTEDNNFIIITGPNMSGKTTFLKQVAILQVMAQIGSYIPAEFASFRVCDKLFSRIGNNDEIETNSSTFMVEMREMSYILHNCTENSLIIIDELGRGTSVEEGVGLCFALCEQLLQTKGFTLFATHFMELTKLENHYFNVSNYNFGIEQNNIEELNSDSYTFTHILEPGVTRELFYGLRLADFTAMDRNILNKALELAQQLYQIQNKPIISGEMDLKKRAKYTLSSMLASLVSDGHIPDKQTLLELQTRYRNQIDSNSVSDESDLQNDFSLV